MPQTLKNSLDINYTKFKLSNGIKCILYPRNEIHSVTIQVNVNVGGLDEDKKFNGVSHFIEHVVHDGTEQLPNWEAIDEFKNQHSGNTNAYTSLDHTQYYGTFPSQYVDQALFYFSQIVLHPLIKPQDVEKERIIILDEMRRDEDEIEYKVLRNFKENRFKDKHTSYSYDIIGTKESMKTSTVEDLANYYKHHYVPENIEIYVIGNIEINEVKNILNKYFVSGISTKEYGSKPVRSFKHSYPEYNGFSINVEQKLDIDQYYLTIDFPGYEFTLTPIEERYKLTFLRSITASSEFNKSILWKRLREELGLVYDVAMWSYDMVSRRVHAVQTSFNKDHLETVLTEIYQGINKIKTKQIDDSVFNARKKKIIDTQLMQLDKPEQVLNWISAYEEEMEEHGRGFMINEYLNFIEGQQFDNAIEVANKMFNWDLAQIGIVSQDDPKEVKEIVTKMWEKIKQSN